MQEDPTRTCEACGYSLRGKRSDARFCSKPCRDKVWYEANAEVLKARSALWFRNNRSRAKISQRRAESADPERYRSYKRKWDASHREYKNARGKAWRAANPEKNRLKCKTWKLANPEKYALIKRRGEQARRANKRKNGGDYSSKEWNSLVAICGSSCLQCGSLGTATTLTVDHVLPISKGGSNDIMNLQPLCSGCNNKKRSKHIDLRTTLQISKMATAFCQQRSLIA